MEQNFQQGYQRPRNPHFSAPKMGLRIRVLLLLLPDLHSGFLRLLGSIYLLSFCRHSKQNGQLAVEPFHSDHSMAKAIPVTQRKRSQPFPPPMVKTLRVSQVFQVLVLKPWRFWRIGMRLELAAFCTGLLLFCRAVQGKAEKLKYKLKPSHQKTQPINSEKLQTPLSSSLYMWDNWGFPEDAALTFLVVGELGVGTCTWSSCCRSCFISLVTHFNYHV